MRGIFTIEPRMEEEVIIMPLFCEKADSTVRMKDETKWFNLEDYLPGCAEDGQSHGEADAGVGPRKWTDAIEDIFPTWVHLIKTRVNVFEGWRSSSVEYYLH